MKFIIAFSCLLVLAYANENADVLRSDASVNVDSFNYIYELSNSVKAEQSGNLQGDTWKVGGNFGYTSPEGEQVGIQYTADENGYNVVSANPPLPTPHPIPEHILRAIEYIKAHPSKEES